ncbi:hypothetical protein vBSscSF1_42 [Staphylococcus phage vB-SscS-F1]|nr:hypothetical protein vBApySJF1_42 [Arcanobacterium phage vB-ApyS-JF1]
MKFNYKSNDFKTITDCKKEIKILKSELCKSLGLERNQFRLSNGLITLYGYDQETKQYYPLCSYINEFNEKIKNPLYSKYYVSCELQTK